MTPGPGFVDAPLTATGEALPRGEPALQKRELQATADNGP